MNYDIIIATKDRADNCTNFVKSLLNQSLHPLRLIVADAGQESFNLEETIRPLLTHTKIEFIYQRTDPGLTRQRNLGLKYVSENSEIVFFFDDDIIFCDPFYIEKILVRLSEDVKHEIGCVFGKIFKNDEIDQSRNKNSISKHWLFIVRKFLAFFSRFFLIASSKVYKVLPSGMNTANQNKTNKECFVNWQPGCCMSFRKEVLKKYNFDESLVGYSMREDLDISYRVSREYKMLYLPSAQILHLESPIQRLNAVNFGEKDIESWHWFVNKNMPYAKNNILFYYALSGYFFLLLISTILFHDKNYYYRFKGGLKTLFRIFRITRLVTR